MITFIHAKETRLSQLRKQEASPDFMYTKKKARNLHPEYDHTRETRYMVYTRLPAEKTKLGSR